MLLLLSYGADVNAMADARHDYRTVLHYAILGGDPAVINLLLKQGARLDLGPDYQKPTALDLAILKGDPSIVEMLLQAGELRYHTPGIRSDRVASEGRRVPNICALIYRCRSSAFNSSFSYFRDRIDRLPSVIYLVGQDRRRCLNRCNKFNLKFSIFFKIQVI